MRIDPKQIPDEVVEAAAKADCEATGINPMTLWQKHGWPDDPPTDHVDEQGRLYFYAWRKRVPRIRATLAAALSAWPGAFRDYYNGDWSIILPLPKEGE